MEYYKIQRHYILYFLIGVHQQVNKAKTAYWYNSADKGF